MKRAIAAPSLILCLLFSASSGRLLSQTRGPQSREELQRQAQERLLKMKQDTEERQRRMRKEHAEWMEQTQKIRADYDDQAWQEALGATPEQWKLIKPRLGKVRNGVSVPALRISIYSYAASGSTSTAAASRISGAGSPAASRAGQSPGPADANRPRTTIHHFASSTPEEGRADDSGQRVAGTEPDSNAPADSRPSSPEWMTATRRAQSQAFVTAGVNISGDILSKPIKKQVGDVCLGWQWPARSIRREKLNEGLRVCEDLLDTLEAENPDPEETRQRIEALRRIRERKQAEYRQAREELRKVVTPAQEAKLILMGYLD
jgi:hypothetical protein